MNHYWLFVISFFQIRAILIIFKILFQGCQRREIKSTSVSANQSDEEDPSWIRGENRNKTILFSILSIFEIFKFVTNWNRVKLSPIHNFMNQTISHFSHSIHNVFEFFYSFISRIKQLLIELITSLRFLKFTINQNPC